MATLGSQFLGTIIMIDPRDIQDLASELSLRPTIVEKDYVLGWLLAGIGNDPEIGQSWIFKGGTCLKKVHFETYRFSEDLDFTVTRHEDLNKQYLQERFSAIGEWIYSQCGIELPADQLRFDVYKNKRDGTNAEGRVYYQGPLRSPRSLPKIKFDLTSDELVVLAPERRRVAHPYADEPSEGIYVQCYPYSEVFAEKTRALEERGRPRDLYDVINLFRQEQARPPAEEVRDILTKKCIYKQINPPTLGSVHRFADELKGSWKHMLGHQLPTLPPFESFWSELPALFHWLEGKKVPVQPAAFRLSAGERVIRVPFGGRGATELRGAALQAIRFAGANRLCVELDYRDEKGERSMRLIEPYSLRRTSSGDMVLHADRTDGRGHRTYRIDRIVGAQATSQTFVPRYAIELTPHGSQSVPSAAPPTRPLPRRRGTSQERTFVYECTVCHRRFAAQSARPQSG